MGSDDPLKLLIAGAPLRPGWGGGEPVIARDLIVGLQSKGFEVVVLPTGRTMAQTAWMTMSPQDWDPYSYLQYAAKLDQIAPDCVLGFYDYDCSLLRAAVDRDIPFVASVHIYWPVCPIGTLYIDGLGNCSGPEMSRCLKHMSRSVPPTRLPLGLSWMPAPLGLSIYLKTRGRMAELKKASAIVVPSQRIREILESFGLANIKEVANGLVLEKIPAQPWTRELSKCSLLQERPARGRASPISSNSLAEWVPRTKMRSSPQPVSRGAPSSEDWDDCRIPTS